MTLTGTAGLCEGLTDAGQLPNVGSAADAGTGRRPGRRIAMKQYQITATVTVTAPDDYNARMVEDALSLAIWHAGDDNDARTDAVRIDTAEVTR